MFDKQALEKSRKEEAAARAALDQATECVRSIFTQLENSIKGANAPEADSSAPSFVDHTNTLLYEARALETDLLILAQNIEYYLLQAAYVFNIRRVIRRIYENLQMLEESPSNITLKNNLKLLFIKLGRYCSNEKDNSFGKNAQLQNPQLAQAVQDGNELLTTIKRRFPLFPL